MQFIVPLDGAAPATGALQRNLTEADPSAAIDIEPGGQRMRVTSSLPTDRLAALITQAGHPVLEGDLQRMPSECCGGCGG